MRAPGRSSAARDPRAAAARSLHFIQQIIEEDLRTGKFGGRLYTRFPPEPNGFLHIGHAKSICLNFGLARDYNGVCNLRFDDTNPAKEEVEYVDSIKEDVRWLGFDWEDRLYHASDYFEQLFEYAVQLIKKGKAYVDSLTSDEIREYRGTLTLPGKNSPYRERTVEENLDMFERMRAGEYNEGDHVLRCKIDMASPNMLMRDPTLYRIKKVPHYRTAGMWVIYPMYDFTHCLSDSIEGEARAAPDGPPRTAAADETRQDLPLGGDEPLRHRIDRRDELLLQAPGAVTDVGLDRAQRHIQLVGYLTVRQTAEVRQSQRLFLFCRQRSQRRSYLLPL